jgi:hypothetical protein
MDAKNISELLVDDLEFGLMEPNGQFQSINLAHEGEKITIKLKNKAPFGVSEAFGKIDMCISLEESEYKWMQMVEEEVKTFLESSFEEEEFVMKSALSNKNPNYLPNIKTRLNKNTLIYDNNNKIKYANYIDQGSTVLVAIQPSGWISRANDKSTVGITWFVKNVQVIKITRKSTNSNTKKYTHSKTVSKSNKSSARQPRVQNNETMDTTPNTYAFSNDDE